ncbi:sugar-phosphatase [Weissella confusa]|uniref:Sugar-phosphatase n=1 Tax=Weissella confusa TaxID=1583 RepID=A0A4Z0RLY7_WEICO|nr:sugar-phosphatase [Weissella confusa]MBJ7615227.1 sugar-phosphatase [Weissella confusa]MBJ7625411.1 sugar-phosphatase [Weissella confusa]MBJ7632118.1 sugar-phosphatase [Weissella confusa]MBJ7638198.1 sugar-phosphatase [Weissella confusa]MBJ7644891.1 sugar-phosphatase [Weissella confusa]
MAIKLITIDIDDTLVNTAKQVTPRVKAALQEATAQGVKVVLTTGRPLPGVQEYLDELGLNHQDDQYAITYNGGVVQTTNGEELGGKELAYSDYLRLREVADELGAYLQVETIDAAYTSAKEINYWASRENFLIKMPLIIKPVDEMDPNDHYVKFMFIGDEADIDSWRDALPADVKEAYYIVKSTPQHLEFMHKDATKGSGLLTLVAKLGIDRSETMALGDQQNDVTMIEAAGLGVAMGNAVPEVKAVADVETTTQNTDGVGVAVEKWVLGRDVPELA